MMNNKQLILEKVKNLIGLPAQNIKLGHGSFITMGFGQDIEIEIKIRGKIELRKQPECF